MEMDHQRDWLRLKMEEDMEHRTPSEEFLFYQAVSRGDVEAVRRNCQEERFTDTEGVGMLSRDPVTNLKYHFVITAAMVTRMCRQNGMDMEQALTLSDFYIRKLDDLRTVREVQKLHDDMVLDYTKKMRVLQRKSANSRHIVLCKEYIQNHIKERITLEVLAEEFELSPSYLSRLFKQETGMSVMDYIRARKIEMAKNLLRFSDSSMIEIAEQLAFSSQSYFIQQFKASTGMTPKKYRDQHYLEPWDSEMMGK